MFYNYSPEIQNAALKLQQAELKYESVKNKAEKDVASAYDKFLIAAENLNYYESKILTSSEELIEISKKAYETGKSDITSLIVMKQSYKQSLSVIHTHLQNITTAGQIFCVKLTTKILLYKKTGKISRFFIKIQTPVVSLFHILQQ